MSVRAVSAVLAAQLPDFQPAPDLMPAARRGCSGRVAKLVLLGLADRADETGANAYPGLRGLARVAMCEVGQVRVALAHLQLAGLVWRTSHGTNGYARDVWALDLPALDALAPVIHTRVAQTHTDRVAQTHGPCVSETHATVCPRDTHKRPQRDEHPGPDCTHRWRTPDGDCPVCLSQTQTG